MSEPIGITEDIAKEFSPFENATINSILARYIDKLNLEEAQQRKAKEHDIEERIARAQADMEEIMSYLPVDLIPHMVPRDIYGQNGHALLVFGPIKIDVWLRPSSKWVEGGERYGREPIYHTDTMHLDAGEAIANALQMFRARVAERERKRQELIESQAREAATFKRWDEDAQERDREQAARDAEHALVREQILATANAIVDGDLRSAMINTVKIMRSPACEDYAPIANMLQLMGQLSMAYSLGTMEQEV